MPEEVREKAAKTPAGADKRLYITKLLQNEHYTKNTANPSNRYNRSNEVEPALA